MQYGSEAIVVRAVRCRQARDGRNQESTHFKWSEGGSIKKLAREMERGVLKS